MTLLLRHFFHPLAGLLFEGDGGSGAGGAGDGGQGGAGDGGQGQGQGQGQGGAAGAGGDGGQGGAGGDGDTWTPPTREEWEAMQTNLGKATQQARKAQRDAEAAATRTAEEQGRFKDLYEGEQAKVGKLQQGVSRAALESTITELAGRLRFANPALAVRLVDTAGIEPSFDEETFVATVGQAERGLLEHRLKQILEETPGLAAANAPRQLPGAGNGGTGGASGNDAMNRMLRGGFGIGAGGQ